MDRDGQRRPQVLNLKDPLIPLQVCDVCFVCTLYYYVLLYVVEICVYLTLLTVYVFPQNL
jgi:hypothetical protein